MILPEGVTLETLQRVNRAMDKAAEWALTAGQQFDLARALVRFHPEAVKLLNVVQQQRIDKHFEELLAEVKRNGL